MIQKEERKSNFELLRIISIVMILLLHYLNASMGGALGNTQVGSKNYYVVRFIESFSIIAVNCFILITGYFNINQKSIKLGKLLNLLGCAIFYGGLCYLFSVYININKFSWQNFGSQLIGIYGSKWFVGSYIVLGLLTPFLNRLIIELNKECYSKLIIILIITLSIVPTFFSKVTYNDRGYGVLTFLMLYFIGGYLRLHHKANRAKKYYIFVYFICSIFTTILVLSKTSINSWWNYNSILNVISSISLFLFFLKLDLRSRIVNYLATYVFPIYIIHSDASIRTYLYRKLFRSELYWNSNYLIMNMIKSIIGILILCIVIEFVRRLILRMINNKLSFKYEIEIFN